MILVCPRFAPLLSGSGKKGLLVLRLRRDLKLLKTKLLPSKIHIFVERIKDMNIQARKLILIEEFLRITDESLITKFESLIRQEKQTAHEKDLKPLSLNEFHDMIDQAKRDSDAGRVISHQELKEKVKTWK